jgi:SH3-like domain-containing protein
MSSTILGYGAAGTPMHLVNRELGWVRVRDPATSREGWIHEEHITVESPMTEAELAPEGTLGSEDREVSEQPARSLKSKKPRKAHKAKKSRKTYASKHVTTRFGRRAFRRSCAAWSEGFWVQY